MKVLDCIIWLRNFLLVFSLLKMQKVYFVIIKFGKLKYYMYKKYVTTLAPRYITLATKNLR